MALLIRENSESYWGSLQMPPQEGSTYFLGEKEMTGWSYQYGKSHRNTYCLRSITSHSLRIRHETVLPPLLIFTGKKILLISPIIQL